MTHKSDQSIFISIASYRDPELSLTIQDCLNKAANPNNIHFGICWQRDETEDISSVKNKNMQIFECDWRESKGACWARHLIQKHFYNDETYYLQLDSHHRFIKHWDIALINLLNLLKVNHPKPIIGSYATTYWPNDTEKNLQNIPYKINTFDSFTDDGDLISCPKAIKNFESNKDLLIPARLLSGHFIFSDGHFVTSCPYDPNYYFRGEELVLSARAYTHGYDFFHPTKTLIWHEYLRKEKNKHWDDHKKDNGFVVEAESRNIKSKARQRQLFFMDRREFDFKQYDFGTERSLHEYELYAGIDFQKRRVHKYCVDLRDDSPHPYVMSEDEWNSGMLHKYEIEVEWDLSKIDPETDYDFWFFGFENNKGELLYRKDFTNEDRFYDQFFTKQTNKFKPSFSSEAKPTRCIIIPHSKSKGWKDRVVIPC